MSEAAVVSEIMAAGASHTMPVDVVALDERGGFAKAVQSFISRVLIMDEWRIPGLHMDACDSQAT
jgi:hypothetical protein